MEVPTKKINNNAPILSGGSPTELQITAERSVIFTRLLTGLGVPRQVQRFIWVIYTNTRPGELYHFNDYQLAADLGCSDSATSRNYVVNLRKKLKQWNARSYDSAKFAHYSFVSVQENSWDPKTKKQNPTGYIFSKSFAAAIDKIQADLHKHYGYKTNWKFALRELIDKAGAADLKEFGFWNERRKSRPRTVEDILGSLLLNWKRLSRRFIETAYSAGMDPETTKSFLLNVQAGYLLQADNQLIKYGPFAQIRVPGGDPEKEVTDENGNKLIFAEFRKDPRQTAEILDTVFKYVSGREEKAETVLPIFRNSRLSEDQINVRCNGERSDYYGVRRNSVQLDGSGQEFVDGFIFQDLPKVSNTAVVDLSRIRSLGTVAKE